jgi:hypothetical protein
MKWSRNLGAVGALALTISLLPAQQGAVNPRVREVVDAVSESRIEATIRKLESFGTRNTMSSQEDPERGIGAARKWLVKELQSYSPRLQVRADLYKVKKKDERLFRDVDLYNVVAVLPGKVSPETQILVTAHYDSLNLVPLPGSKPGGVPVSIGERTVQYDWQKVDVPAPGACDDGSGTAVVMELARVMSHYDFDKTLVFVAFAGEEQALAGSTLHAARARREHQAVEAVLNNDIVGTEVSGNGRGNGSTVNLYAGDAMDSGSQALARYARTIAVRYMPGMQLNVVFQQDRLARGGDHTPFQLEGFAAVRVSTPSENYANQHSATDLLANMSVPYTARVARVNAAVAASLALAPRPPIVVTEAKAGALKGRMVPMITRGKTRYDAQLRWKSEPAEADLLGYAVVVRTTTSPWWEQEIFVGSSTEFTLKDVSIDDARFGVKAIDREGNESLVSTYVFPPRERREIETY